MTVLETVDDQCDRARAQLRAAGAILRGEANDLKRTPQALAEEIGWDRSEVEAVLDGRASLGKARELAGAMVGAFPIPWRDVLTDELDTEHGVRAVSADESRASSRVFLRETSPGARRPYYEYRDTAMSRTAPFRPEWIRPLVEWRGLGNEGIRMNNGHLLHQFTFFIGEVGFHWRHDGELHSAEMQTGDSCYIPPFVPHCFTSRSADQLGLIIAVTYGGAVKGALSELRMLDSRRVITALGHRKRGDIKSAGRQRVVVQRRCAAYDDRSAISVRRFPFQRERLAGPLGASTHTAYLLRASSVAERTRFARSMRHSYFFNPGKRAVALEVRAKENEVARTILTSGASAYVQPFVPFRLIEQLDGQVSESAAKSPELGPASWNEGANLTPYDDAQVLAVHVRGMLSAEVLAELSAMGESGLRAVHESMCWFT